MKALMLAGNAFMGSVFFLSVLQSIGGANTGLRLFMVVICGLHWFTVCELLRK